MKEYEYETDWLDRVIFDPQNRQIGVGGENTLVQWVSMDERTLVDLAHQIIKEYT